MKRRYLQLQRPVESRGSHHSYPIVFAVL